MGKARLLAYAKEQKPSLWIKAQPAFVGNQGKTVIDPDFETTAGCRISGWFCR